jgi:hypothetical protein
MRCLYQLSYAFCNSYYWWSYVVFVFNFRGKNCDFSTCCEKGFLNVKLFCIFFLYQRRLKARNYFVLFHDIVTVRVCSVDCKWMSILPHFCGMVNIWSDFVTWFSKFSSSTVLHRVPFSHWIFILMLVLKYAKICYG